MDRFLHGLWVMFSNNGQHSAGEMILIGACSLAMAIGLMIWNGHQTAKENRADKISDLGYRGYLEHKRLMKSVGIDVD